MSNKLVKTLLGLVAVGLVASLLACASMKAASAKQNYIHSQTSKHVYDKPCQQVWPDARSMLFELGYSVKDTGEGTARTVETEWKTERHSSTSSNYYSNRYLVQGIQKGENGEKCKVRFTRNTRQSDGDVTSSRDLDMEWKLLQRVNPSRAAAIQSEAETRAQAAKNN